MIHDNTPHANEYLIPNSTPMDNRIMANGHFIANCCWCCLIGRVDHCAILNIDPVPNCDAIHITANNSLKPYAAVVAHNNIADERCVFGKITTRPIGRCFSINCFEEHEVRFVGLD